MATLTTYRRHVESVVETRFRRIAKRTVSSIRINEVLSTAFRDLRQRPFACIGHSARLIRRAEAFAAAVMGLRLIHDVIPGKKEYESQTLARRFATINDRYADSGPDRSPATEGRAVFYGSRRMMSISASTISKTLDRAFRAAFLLTGSADTAEGAVMDGIAGLESGDDAEKVLVAKTIESLIGHRPDFPHRLDRALALLPHELQRLVLLAPVSRACFLLRILFGITTTNCAMALNLTIEEFEESLRTALEQLSIADALICSRGPIHQTEGAHQ
jgi:hypothetical protein